MHYQTESEIENLVTQFQNQTLPPPAWTHEAHLTVAVWHLKNHTLPEATCLLRSGIITYNKASGGKNTPTGGYHETITLLWIKIIHDFVCKNSDINLLDLCNAFLASEYATREFPLQFYSRELLFSTDARAFWVEPDLKNLNFR